MVFSREAEILTPEEFHIQRIADSAGEGFGIGTDVMRSNDDIYDVYTAMAEERVHSEQIVTQRVLESHGVESGNLVAISTRPRLREITYELRDNS